MESQDPIEFENVLKRKLQSMGRLFNVDVDVPTMQEGLESLVTQISNERGVVVLVDEYDHPIINNLKSPEVAEKNRECLKRLFGTLKGLDSKLKFTFFTGISKFSKVSIFSGLNNLNDITMKPQYAGIMGYTEDELKRAFQSHIQEIANERNQEGSLVSEEDILDEVKEWYNGYRFSEQDLRVYNPFSTLHFMQNKEPETYWYDTRTPSFLIDELKKHDKSMISLDGTTATKGELKDISSTKDIKLKALMYQTGYFTIKGYDRFSKQYDLGFPNEEVRSAFIHSLVENFAKISNLRTFPESVEALEKHA